MRVTGWGSSALWLTRTTSRNDLECPTELMSKQIGSAVSVDEMLSKRSEILPDPL